MSEISTDSTTMNAVMLSLGRIEAKLDLNMEATKDHAKRIQRLESGRNFERGIAATVGAIASFAAQLLLKGVHF